LKSTKSISLPEASSDSEPVQEGNSSRWGPFLLSCGFLPLAINSSVVGNGLHDVAMSYTAIEPSREFCLKANISPETIILSKAPSARDVASTQSTGAPKDGNVSGIGSVVENLVDGTESAAAVPTVTQSSTLNELLGSISFESSVELKFGLARSRLRKDQMELQVRGVCKRGLISRSNYCLTFLGFAVKVRTVVHSSLHAQSSTVSEILRQDPDPRPILLSDWTKLAIPLAATREDLVGHLSHMDLPAAGRMASTNEERLLQLTMEVSTQAMNSDADLSNHIIRVASHLWKAMIVGTGEHDLLWANPASAPPIRIQSLASIVQLISSVSTFMAKLGMSHLNGLTKFNAAAFGRVLAICFDEGVFGAKSKERFDFQNIFHLDQPIQPDATTLSADNDVKYSNPDLHKEKRNRHVRSNYDLFNEIPTRSSTKSFIDLSHCETGELLKRNFDSNGISKSLEDSLIQFRTSSLATPMKDAWLTPGGEELPSSSRAKILDHTGDIKVDSGWEFLSMLSSNADVHESDEEIRSNASRTMLHSLGSIPGGTGRRWMTAPMSSALETIREDDDSDKGEKQEEGRQLPVVTTTARRGKSRKEEDSLDTELVVRQTKSSVKQMRVPNVKKTSNPSDITRAISEDALSNGPSSPSKSLPGTEEEIVDAGTAFLDVIGKSLGYR
jgi:hypothetical protein